MIDIPRAFTYAFDDPQWLPKLLMVGIVTLASLVLTPLLIGIAGFAILLGYEVELIRNIRRGEVHPLPGWGDFGSLLSLGINPLIAGVAYNLPNLFIGLIIAVITFTASDGLLSGGLVMLALCCFLPLLIVYNIAIQPVFTLALGRYAEDQRLGVFFQFSQLIGAVRSRTDLLVQWLLGSVIALVLLGLVEAIPCIGWVVGLTFTLPILGWLNGQYAAAALDKGKRKNA